MGNNAPILVTGGAGFIGSHVVSALLARGDAVVCVDNFDAFYDPAIKRQNLQGVLTHPNFALVEADIRDPAAMEEVFRRHPIRRVFHAAARAGVRPSVADPLLYEDVNVRGTLVLLELARQAAVAPFVFASSSSVYGELSAGPFQETTALLRPISPYAATKLAGEQLCYTYHHLYGLPATCLRFFTVYGPRQRPEMAIHRFVKYIEEGRPVPLYGDGSARRDFTYVDDVLQGILAALDRPMGYEIINLGESETIEMRDLIRVIEQSLGKPAVVEYLPAQQGDVSLTHADVSKAKRLLGYRPSTTVKDGIGRFVAWYRATRQGAS